MKFRGVMFIALATILSVMTANAQFKAWNRLLLNNGSAIALNPLNSNTLYATQNAWFVISRDQGKSWQTYRELSLYEANHILVHPFDSLKIFVTGGSELFKSTNGGFSWRVVISEFSTLGRGIVYHPMSPDTMFAMSSQGKFYRSDNRGETWSLISQFSQIKPHTIVIHPTEPNVMYLGGFGDSCIYKSADYGVSWVGAKSPRRATVSSIVILRSDPDVAYAAASYSATPNTSGLWRTTDRGYNWFLWKLNNIPLTNIEIDQDRPDTMYAGTFGDSVTGVWKTTDGGTTWEFLRKLINEDNPIIDTKIDPNNPDNVYMSEGFGASFPGVFKFEESDAAAIGIVRDSTSHAPIEASEFTWNDPFAAINVNQYGYEAFRLPGSAESTFVIHTSSSGYYPQDDTIRFQIDSVVRHDILLRTSPPPVNGIIRGTVFNDRNGNGVRDSGDAGIPGCKITMNFSQQPVAFTDSAGTFTFWDVTPGYYDLSQRVEYGWTQTFPGSVYEYVLLNSGDSLSTIDFGNHQGHHVTAVTPHPYSMDAQLSPTITLAFDTSIAQPSISAPGVLTVTGMLTGLHACQLTLLPGDSGVQLTPDVPFRRGEHVNVNLAGCPVGPGLESITAYSFQFEIGGIKPSTGTFYERASFSVGSTPGSIAAGDFDLDGDVDVVTADYADAKLSVLLNNGDGTFGGRTDYGVLNGPQSVTVRDLDGDSTLDIVAVNNLQYSISVMKGKGDGTFWPAVSYPLTQNPYALAIVDFDGDGDEDILVAQYYTGVDVFSNNGHGGFSQTSSFSAGAGPYDICAADLNADGGTDLAVLSYASPHEAIILRNIGHGAMSLDRRYGVGMLPGAIETADLNSDLLPDILVSNSSSAKISLFFEQAGASFAPKIDFATGNNPLGMATADLDGDGDMDFVVANSGSSSISIFNNDGAGNFTRNDFGAGTNPKAVAAADFDNDGDLDIATANSGDNTFSISFNGTLAMKTTVSQGWNLLSLPINTGFASPALNYPRRASPIFGFHDKYQAEDSLSIGAGYWIKFDSSDTLLHGGLPIARESVSVHERWNLVGSLSTSIPVSGISSSPSGLTTSPFFRYNTQTRHYEIADTIVPGSGYFVKSGSPGKIILSSSPGSANASQRIRISRSDELPPPAPDDALAQSEEVVKEFALDQNYPNPFNPTTSIHFSIASEGNVSLRIYDVLGREIAKLVDEVRGGGNYSVTWDASRISSGIYFYKLEASGYSNTKKMLLLR